MEKVATKTLKEQIASDLYHAGERLVKALPGPKIGKAKDNLAPYLAEVFFWQEVAALANASLREAWSRVQEPKGPLPDDDELRGLDFGDNSVTSAGNFVVVAKLSQPKSMFDRESFITTVAKRYKISPTRLAELAEKAVKESKPSLSKKVLES
jgi:hypothetical protein